MAEIIGVVSFVFLALLLSSLKIVPDYERLIIFQLGRVKGMRGPGLQMVVPFLEHFVKLDLRSSSIPLHLHEVVTRDDVTIEIKANCLFQIGDPVKLIRNLEDPKFTTEQVVKSALTGAIKQNDFEHLVQGQSQFLKRLCTAIDKQTAKLGIRVTLIQLEEIKILRGQVSEEIKLPLSDSEVGNEEETVDEELQLVTDILEDKSSRVEELELAPTGSMNEAVGYQYGSHSYVYGHEMKEPVDS
jgi:regulator of protease activity HflC (stomatin/prohibitin superfamily)